MAPRLGPIQQLWFAEPDTGQNWVVCLVCHNTLCRYALTLRLGPIQQFWFAELDTDTNWVVRLICHDTLCQYVLTLHGTSKPTLYRVTLVATPLNLESGIGQKVKHQNLCQPNQTSSF